MTSSFFFTLRGIQLPIELTETVSSCALDSELGGALAVALSDAQPPVIDSTAIENRAQVMGRRDKFMTRRHTDAPLGGQTQFVQKVGGRGERANPAGKSAYSSCAPRHSFITRSQISRKSKRRGRAKSRNCVSAGEAATSGWLTRESVVFSSRSARLKKQRANV